jgi:hypothetical protein
MLQSRRRPMFETLLVVTLTLGAYCLLAEYL